MLSLTSLLAFYGAVLSSIGFGWNLYRDLQDKARLKLDMRIRRIVRSPDGKWYQVIPDMPVEGASNQLFLVANVTNVGRRPVKWIGWGGKFYEPEGTKRGFIVQPTHLPIMLTEGESSSEFTPDVEKAVRANVKILFINDAAGKSWYLSWWAMRRLKSDYRKFREASRGFLLIRKEEGKPDVPIVFPNAASHVDAIRCCESEGYTILTHKVIDTPEDENYQNTIVVTVQPTSG